jgi:hypothetical protein
MSEPPARLHTARGLDQSLDVPNHATVLFCIVVQSLAQSVICPWRVKIDSEMARSDNNAYMSLSKVEWRAIVVARQLHGHGGCHVGIPVSPQSTMQT